MSAQESMEHAEHAEHASSENRKIALLIAVIALCLALSETLGKGAQTESIAKNVEASNLWAFFQAKSIRRTTVQTAAEQAKLAGPGDDATKAAVQKQIEDWQKTAARYRSEPETGEGQDQLSDCFTCTIHIYFLEYVPYALPLRPDTIYEKPFALPNSYINCTTR